MFPKPKTATECGLRCRHSASSMARKRIVWRSHDRINVGSSQWPVRSNIHGGISVTDFGEPSLSRGRSHSRGGEQREEWTEWAMRGGKKWPSIDGTTRSLHEARRCGSNGIETRMAPKNDVYNQNLQRGKEQADIGLLGRT